MDDGHAKFTPDDDRVRGTLIALDIEGFNDEVRTDEVRVTLRARLRCLLLESLAASGIRVGCFEVRDTEGDGYLVTVSGDAEPSVLRGVLPALHARLVGYHETLPAAAVWSRRLRLRVAVHNGRYCHDPIPIGKAVNYVCRLRDMDELRVCLRSTQQPLIVAVSEQVHEDVVAQGYGGDPSVFKPMTGRHKDVTMRFWVHVPGDSSVVDRVLSGERGSAGRDGTGRDGTRPHGIRPHGIRPHGARLDSAARGPQRPWHRTAARSRMAVALLLMAALFAWGIGVPSERSCAPTADSRPAATISATGRQPRAHPVARRAAH